MKGEGGGVKLKSGVEGANKYPLLIILLACESGWAGKGEFMLCTQKSPNPFFNTKFYKSWVPQYNVSSFLFLQQSFNKQGVKIFYFKLIFLLLKKLSFSTTSNDEPSLTTFFGRNIRGQKTFRFVSIKKITFITSSS